MDLGKRASLTKKVDAFPNLSFWGLFFLLNALLFLPFYLINWQFSTFFPNFDNEIGDSSLRWYILKLLVIRQNADIFRLSVDWVLCISAWVWIRPIRRQLIRYLLTGFFIFSLLYNAYDTFVFAFYNDYPNFYDDILLLINGIGGVIQYLGIPVYVYLFGLIGVMLFCIGCVWLVRQITVEARLLQLNRYSHLLLLLMVGYVLAMVLRYAEFIDHPRIVAGSVAAKINRNLQQSLSTYQNQQLMLKVSDLLPTAYNYDQFPLAEKPDIYLIVVESYGDALYQFEDLHQPYRILLNELDSQLEQNGWQTASIRSKSPIRGGKSWLSYASLLFGLRIDDEAQYDVLLDAFQERSYPHLGQYLKGQGYDYQRITPLLVTQEQDVAEWERTRRFFGYDRWLFLNDMEDYAGPRYGWGPSPPDQYSLSFLRATTEAKYPETPHLFFYITHNSHLPWVEPPQLVADWRSLATASPNLPANYDPFHETKAAYLQSIFYQLEMVTSIILQGPDDALYIIVGDHQPPLRAFSDYEGTATPLHIISQNGEVMDALVAREFVTGLHLGEATIKHEGFYSLFMQVLLTSYADFVGEELPAIQPNGLDLESLAQEANR